jgi:hypothetical protein
VEREPPFTTYWYTEDHLLWRHDLWCSKSALGVARWEPAGRNIYLDLPAEPFAQIAAEHYDRTRRESPARRDVVVVRFAGLAFRPPGTGALRVLDEHKQLRVWRPHRPLEPVRFARIPRRSELVWFPQEFDEHKPRLGLVVPAHRREAAVGCREHTVEVARPAVNPAARYLPSSALEYAQGPRELRLQRRDDLARVVACTPVLLRDDEQSPRPRQRRLGDVLATNQGASMPCA